MINLKINSRHLSSNHSLTNNRCRVTVQVTENIQMEHIAMDKYSSKTNKYNKEQLISRDLVTYIKMLILMMNMINRIMSKKKNQNKLNSILEWKMTKIIKTISLHIHHEQINYLFFFLILFYFLIYYLAILMNNLSLLGLCTLIYC